MTLLQAQASGFTPRSSESPDASMVFSAKRISIFFAIRQLESGTEISGNSPSLMGVRKVGVLLNKSAQADAVGHGRPVVGIPAIHGGEDVKLCNAVAFQPPHNERLFVNKTELIEHIAKNADISKAAATRALESFIGAVKSTLQKEESVSLVGFGTFTVGKREGRIGRNPRTGDEIKIKEARVPKFRPGKALKDALN